jgi:hypothetical protein
MSFVEQAFLQLSHICRVKIPSMFLDVVSVGTPCLEVGMAGTPLLRR